jgi:hypothetical protein
MSTALTVAGTIGLLAFTVGIAIADETAKTWSFDADEVDAAPAGFTFGRTGKGAAGRWG